MYDMNRVPPASNLPQVQKYCTHTCCARIPHLVLAESCHVINIIMHRHWYISFVVTATHRTGSRRHILAPILRPASVLSWPFLIHGSYRRDLVPRLRTFLSDDTITQIVLSILTNRIVSTIIPLSFQPQPSNISLRRSSSVSICVPLMVPYDTTF